jgi:hypothetical protein
MAQALLISTLVTIAGLIATMVFGFRATSAHPANHIFMALVTVVIGLFSQSMTMFFFIGTGKAFKSQVFPAATWAMTAIMITFITGGGVGNGRTPVWLHNVLSVISIVLYARAYWIQIRAMNENANLMERYLKD